MSKRTKNLERPQKLLRDTPTSIRLLEEEKALLQEVAALLGGVSYVHAVVPSLRLMRRELKRAIALKLATNLCEYCGTPLEAKESVCRAKDPGDVADCCPLRRLSPCGVSIERIVDTAPYGASAN